MYAVVGVWNTDPGMADQHQDSLLNRIVPGVRQLPALVTGYWAGKPDGDRSYTFILFEDASAAEAFAAGVRANAAAQAGNGVTNVELAVVPVVAQT